MKTTITLMDMVFTALRIGGMTSIYKQKRPDAPDLASNPVSYIVVNALPLANNHVSYGVINVNVYCRDINVAKRIPDLKKLQTLSDEVISILDGYYMSGVHASLQSMGVVQEIETSEHYVNHRFEINILN